MKKIILGIILLFLAGCTQSSQEKPFFADEQLCKNAGGEWVETPFETYRCSVGTQTECERLGGFWEKQGLLGNEACVFTYPDAGKSCTSSDQCLGGCVVIEGPGGECKETDTIFGCFTFVDGPALCVD